MQSFSLSVLFGHLDTFNYATIDWAREAFVSQFVIPV